MKLARIGFAVLGLFFAPDPARANCLTNYFENPGHEFQSSAPAEDWGNASYDIVAGTGEAAMGGGVSELPAGAYLFVQDMYQIVGPASASPIPLVVRMHLTGIATGGYWNFPNIGTRCVTSDVRGVLVSSPAGSVHNFHASCDTPSVNIDHELMIQIAHLPGESFRIETSLEITTNQGTEANAAWVLSFEFPAGYHVGSCNGYGGQVVPAMSSTWGRVKRSYR